MSRINNSHNQFKDSINLGKKSNSLIPKIKNWCSNIKIDSEYGGMMGEMGLPTMNTISCTQFRGGSAMNLEWIAHDFIVGNCPNCKFHNELSKNNFGRVVLIEHEKRRKKREREKSQELEIIRLLEQKLNDFLKDKEKLKTTEVSILKLLISLKESSSNIKKKANELFEASKLSPSFFTSLSLDYLSIYLNDDEINNLIIDSCQNIIAHNENVISKYFQEKVISLIENEKTVNLFLKVLPFKNLKKEQVINISPYLIKNYDLSSFDRYNHFENHSTSIISFFNNLYITYREDFYFLFKKSLQESDSNFRANTVLILNHLFSLNCNTTIPLIKDLVKSLDLQDSDFPKSADFIISNTLVKITKSHAQKVFDTINNEFEKMTIGGKIEVFRFYELYINDSKKNTKSTYTLNLINQLIKICLDKNPPELKKKAINTLENFSRENPEMILKDFDSFIGVLSNSVIAKSTFEWYKKDLDKDTLTFNPLKGKNVYDIINEENKLEHEIRELKGILKNLLKHNPTKLYEKLIEIIRNIEEKDKNGTQLKLFFIEILRDGVNDSILLTNILPDLHSWLLDFKNISLRVQALKFIEKLLSNHFNIVPQTIFSLLEIFLNDSDNLIKKYTILCYKQILINKKRITNEDTKTLLNLYKDKYVIVHKTATEITYKLFDLLDIKGRHILLAYLLDLLEVYHNENDRDVEFCKKLFKQSMYVSKGVNPNHFDKVEKVLIKKYLIEYCRNGDYYSCLNSLKELNTFRKKNSYYNALWLECSLLFLNKTTPNKFQPFLNSDRGKIYIEILSLNLIDLLSFKEIMKENIKKRSLENIDLYINDLNFTLIIFSFYGLNEDILEITSFIKEKIPSIKTLDYFFNKIDEFSRFAKLALIKQNNISNLELSGLIDNQEISKNEVIAIQEALTKKQFTLFYNFKIKNIDIVLNEKNELLSNYKKLEDLSSNSKEEGFFFSLKSLGIGILFLIEWSKDILEGNINSNSKLIASKTNMSLINTDCFSHIPLLKEQIQNIIESIKVIKDFNPEKIIELVNKYAEIKIPFIYHLRKNEKKFYSENINEKTHEENEVNIVSLELYIRNNPWANPQILKSKEVYIIKGIVKLNNIPSGYKILKIQPSTTSSKIFELNIEEIQLDNDKLQYEVNGSILFNYSQNSLDELITIKLIPFFSNKKDKICPTIIGYDELITKVLDEKNEIFQTGFKMMDKKSFELYNDPLIKQLDNEEKNNFFTLLNGIVNYQGYCLQSGKYKGVKNYKEDKFRDELIQHLTANPSIGENISKEAHNAGGRVEITFKGIPTELKVETKLSERNKIIEKYGNQPLAYSSGNSKLVSIICVLDLTEKKSPPSPAINNIIINTMKTHGFQNNNSEYKPFQIFVFIDGNTKNPSDYSK
ncbi:hypothetical protein [Mangrovimonas cancribranchiae]|uniref:Uncharacterized protein n=1 Tax=Mangrovimonas cancribranchiae TaxID=3080055 RepID=A0AAU6NZP6_9FLAO